MLLFLHNSLMNILQNIFNDLYEEMLYILHPRQAVIDNVDKRINCGAPSFGGAMYAYSKCVNPKCSDNPYRQNAHGVDRLCGRQAA